MIYLCYMKFLKYLSVLILGICCNLSGYSEAPKREFRGVWFTTVYNIDWPTRQGSGREVIKAQQAELDKYLDRFAELRLTTVCFQVRSLADAMYRSSYEPWSASLTGTRGKDPGWDPLAYVVDGCHRRGLECYAWVNPFRWSAGPDYDTEYDRDFKARGMLLNFDKYTVFNPALPQSRSHILNVCREIVSNYAIDGMLFDDYFYPNNIPEDETADDYMLYSQMAVDDQPIGDWRRDNINFLVAEIAEMISQTRPEVRFGIGPAGVAGKDDTSAPHYKVESCPVKATDWQYATIYSDPLAWLEEGSIDFISPQLYWPTTHTTAPFEPLTRWWSDVAHKYERHHYASQSLSSLKKGEKLTGEEVTAQVSLNRKYNKDDAPGSCYFSAKPLFGELGEALEGSVYSYSALPPVVDWKYKLKYGAVKDLNSADGMLSWSEIEPEREGSIVRYAVYAIPRDVKLSRHERKNIPACWLMGVTYSPYYRLPSSVIENQDEWLFAVTVLDGFGREHKAAFSK